jgi:hypothetical protein
MTDSAMAQATVTLTLVCPHCEERFSLHDKGSIDAAQSHVLAHLSEDAHHPPG